MFWDILDLSDGLPAEETVTVLNNQPCCAQINENGVTVPGYGGAIVPATDKILQTGLAAGYFIDVNPHIFGLAASSGSPVGQSPEPLEADPKPRRGRPKQEPINQAATEEVVIELQEDAPVEIVLNDSVVTEK